MTPLTLAGGGARLAGLVARVWEISRLEGEVNVIIADRGRLAALNLEFRGRPEATDVLTFPLAGDPVWGEIYVAADLCPDGEDRVLWVLDRVIHGLLHLDGCHHSSDEEEAANGRST
ncbi:rRNA maturation RNAse YbeY [bacterium]|nr:rRNA maturation RNAse YbeY [bacterium]